MHQIAKNFGENQERIQRFFQEKSRDLIPSLYLSCDIRNSGRKLGVIDTNLFPAGFNNLCNAYSRTATLALKKYFDQYYPSVKKILILIEEHTRNRFYLENAHRLQSLFQSIGLQTRLAYPGVEIPQEEFTMDLGEVSLHLEKIHTDGGIPQVRDLVADLVISNNDFSQGIPESLRGVMEKIIPSPLLGWHQRSKTRHFEILQVLVEEFSQVVQLDPWLLSCFFKGVQKVDLTREDDVKRLAAGVEEILGKIQEKYARYGIEEAPYVFIKNDSGTYGMGLMDISGPDEVLQMNRRTRNKLLSSKGGAKADSFLIQEGIPTADFYSGLPIEPVIYMVGFDTVGGFFRMNPERDAQTSLNTKGMIFSCLCLHKLDEPHEEAFLNCAEKENLVQLSNIMAHLAAIAGAIEQKGVLAHGGVSK